MVSPLRSPRPLRLKGHMHLSEINIYPIKSCKGISLTEAKTERRGLQYDRRWMLVDDSDWFVTQRRYPKLATIAVAVTADGLQVTSDVGSTMSIPFRANSPRITKVRIWRNRVRAEAYAGEINEWFSDVIGAKLRLVYMPDTTERLAHAPFKVRPDDVVSFADGYPFFLLTEASLSDLNSRLKKPVPMSRFRANFVVLGAEPFAEDTWRRFTIGDNVFHGVKLCGRCVITTIDQETGLKTGPDPLKTLARYRTIKVGSTKGARFGQNLIAESADGTVRVGDRVRVIGSL